MIVMASIAVLLIVVEAVDAAGGYRLDQHGIRARQVDGLSGILWAPFLHADFEHLFANLVPGLLLGFLVLMTRQFLAVTAVAWLCSGLGVWLIGPGAAVTVGASGIVFGWLAFLIVRGAFNRALGQIALGLVVLAVYGSVLWGVLPRDDSVSWQGHLCGALGGVLAAWLLRPRTAGGGDAPSIAPPAPPRPPAG